MIEKFPEEHELVDRARVYLTICQKGQKKESVNLKTVEDYLLYAQMKNNQADYEGALKLLEKALEFKKEEARIYYLMAIAYVQSNRPEDSLEVLKKGHSKR
jgi:tetratricopeptide (TPR) repeat protein